MSCVNHIDSHILLIIQLCRKQGQYGKDNLTCQGTFFSNQQLQCHTDYGNPVDLCYYIIIKLPYCLKLRLVSYKRQVSISGLGIAHYNIVKHIVQCFMCHQLPLEFIASITDYKQHAFLSIISVMSRLVAWLKIAGKK